VNANDAMLSFFPTAFAFALKIKLTAAKIKNRRYMCQ